MAPWCLCKQNEAAESIEFRASLADLVVLEAMCSDRVFKYPIIFIIINSSSRESLPVKLMHEITEISASSLRKLQLTNFNCINM